MKKVFVFLILCVIATTTALAQCVEVKGVETRKVDNDTEKGFEFNNLNNYTVTIEAELRRPVCGGGGGQTYVTIETKTFVIDQKETYLWKAPFWVKHPDCVYMDTYVVFKTFKCP